MKIFSFLSALALGATVNALPGRRTVSVTKTTLPGSTSSSTPTSTPAPGRPAPTAWSNSAWFQLILDDEKKCRVKYRYYAFEGVSNPIGSYNHASDSCNYERSSHSTGSGNSTMDMSIPVDQPDVLVVHYLEKIGNPSWNYNVPLGRKPGCQSTADLDYHSNAKLYHTEQKCGVDLNRFYAYNKVNVAYYPGSSTIKSTVTSAPSAAPQASTDQSATLPMGYGAPPEADAYFGIYKEGDDCKIWGHNIPGIGSAQFASQPVGTFDPATKKCVSAGERYRLLDLGGTKSLMVWFEDDNGYNFTAGDVFFLSSENNLRLPVGLKPSCRSWWSSKSNQMWSDPWCEVDLKKYDRNMGAGVPNALEWSR